MMLMVRELMKMFFKGGHKEVPALAACRDDPVIPEPEVPILILVEQSRPFRVIHAPYTP